MNKRPKTDPCGTPEATAVLEELVPLTLTNNILVG